jgi:hypothetical protein
MARGSFVSLAILIDWIVLLLFCCKASLASNAAEAEALLRWKDSLGNQSILQSWVAPANANSSTLSPCQWRGITCDDAGNVTQINLPNVGLTGTLQYLDFSSLTNLLRLDLRENQLTGTIPSLELFTNSNILILPQIFFMVLYLFLLLILLRLMSLTFLETT